MHVHVAVCGATSNAWINLHSACDDSPLPYGRASKPYAPLWTAILILGWINRCHVATRSMSGTNVYQILRSGNADIFHAAKKEPKHATQL